MTDLILRFDDIAPGMAWSKFLPLKETIESMDIHAILGVVPECRDPKLEVETRRKDFFNYVRAWQSYGDTVAQHGTYHLYDTNESGLLGINLRSEFAGHSLPLQLERLGIGKDILLSEGVWQPYFMAPAHSFDKNTIDALMMLGFSAATDGYGLYSYKYRGLTFVPQLAASPFNVGFGLCTICVHVNTMSVHDIEHLLRFIKSNRNRFISFDKAINKYAPAPIICLLLHYMSQFGLRAVRSLRLSRLMNGLISRF